MARIRGGILVSAAAVALMAGQAQAAQTTLVIGDLLESTGPFSVTAPAMAKATKLAMEEATKAAKVAGIDIEIKEVSADAQGDPQAAQSAARNLADKGASCIIGPATTPESIAVANGVTIAKKITLWPTATSVRLRTIDDKGTIFRAVPADSLQALAVVDGLAQSLGSAQGKTVAVAYRNEPYGEGLYKAFAEAWQKKGGKVAGPVVYDPAQASFDSEAEKIVAGNPDAYFVIDYPDSYVKMGAALVRTGKFDAKKLFVPDAMSFPDVPSNIPAQALEGAKGTRAGTPESTAAYKAFDSLWKSAGGADHFSLDANQFDAATVCILAAVAAKSSDPTKMIEKVREVTMPPGDKYNFTQLADAMKALAAGKKIDFDGVSGPLEFGKDGDPTASLYDIFEYKGGKMAVLRQVDVAK